VAGNLHPSLNTVAIIAAITRGASSVSFSRKKHAVVFGGRCVPQLRQLAHRSPANGIEV
jgi:hypothetical protein